MCRHALANLPKLRVKQHSRRRQQSEPQAVQHRVPIESVPDADEQKNHHRRRCARHRAPCFCAEQPLADFRQPDSSAARHQRVQQIGAEPHAEADVPAPPVIRNACGKEWSAEVLRQVDAQHLRRAANNVNAAGKVRIQHDGVHRRCRQHKPARQFLRRRHEHTHRRHQTVSDDKFLEKAPRHQEHTGHKAIR